MDAQGSKEQAQALANEHNTPVTVRDTTTDKVLATVKPRKAKAKAAKPAAKSKAKPVAKAKPDGERKPRGMVVEILKLASRRLR